MPPHGPGMFGACHSHDPEYFGDEWNLYCHLDKETTTALNVTTPSNTVGIFKPQALKFSPVPIIASDADEEIIVIARFESPVSVRKIMIIGGGEEANHPQSVKCYVNHENVDFTSIGSLRVTHESEIPLNIEGTHEILTPLHPFTNINTLVLYFPNNYGSDQTIIQYIGLQGDHTHYRREAVHDATYELLCNGQDIVQPEDSLGQAKNLH